MGGSDLRSWVGVICDLVVCEFELLVGDDSSKDDAFLIIQLACDMFKSVPCVRLESCQPAASDGIPDE